MIRTGVDDALRAVLEHYSVEMRDLYGTRRDGVLLEARRVAAVVLHELDLSWAGVARELGRDVSTVNGWRRDLTEDDWAEVRRILEKLGVAAEAPRGE